MGRALLSPQFGRPRVASPRAVFGVGFAFGVDLSNSVMQRFSRSVRVTIEGPLESLSSSGCHNVVLPLIVPCGPELLVSASSCKMRTAVFSYREFHVEHACSIRMQSLAAGHNVEEVCCTLLVAQHISTAYQVSKCVLHRGSRDT